MIDLVYLEPGAASPDYLRELRLQHLEQLDLQKMREMAARTGKPKLERAADIVAELAEEEASEYENL